MNTVGFVPIKLNNQRVPGKNTKKFDDGTSLVTFFLRKLLAIELFDDLYCFCSDFKIREYIPEGVKLLIRPRYLDDAKATPQDIIKEFIKLVDADVYAVCHCTSPFVTIEHFQECTESVTSNRFDSSFTAHKIQKLLWNEDFTPMNFDPANIPRTQELKAIYEEVSAAYVFKKDVFIKTGRRIGSNPHMTVVNGIECIDIDNPEDFDIANAVYMNFFSSGRSI